MTRIRATGPSCRRCSTGRSRPEATRAEAGRQHGGRGGRGGDRGAAGPVRGPAALRDGGAARRGRCGAEPDEPRRGQGGDRRGGRLAGSGVRRLGRRAGPRVRRRAGAAGSSVVVGCDARHRSAEFADEAAGVLAGSGIAVHMLPRPCPTPLLAFAVRHLGTAAGIMITASHNPAADNGYKLYLSDGAQVIPPADAEIEKRIAALGPLAQVPVAAAGSPLITRHGDEIAQAYLAAIVAIAGPSAGPALSMVYTPMHGVAGGLMLRALRQAGFAPPHVVAAQAEPDPDFPTVAFPNPEEPGALDLALADARRLGADLVVASDPDGDRLAVAVPDRAGERRRRRGRRATGGGRQCGGRQCGGRRKPLAGADRRPGGCAAGGEPAGADGRAGGAGGAAGGLYCRFLDAAGQDRRGGRRPVRRDADRVQVDRPGGRPRAGGAVRVRLRGGARLRRRRRGAG